MQRTGMVLVGLLLVLAICTAGCKSVSYGQVIQDLKEGKARGSLKLSSHGRPLAAGAETTFFLGPGGAVQFDGEVDYGEWEPLP